MWKVESATPHAQLVTYSPISNDLIILHSYLFRYFKVGSINSMFRVG